MHWQDWCWSWNSNTLATWWEGLTHLKRPWCWERLKVGEEGEDRGWNGWMASPTQATWVRINSWSWWWTGMPDVLQSMGSQRVRHDWTTELNWTEITFRKEPEQNTWENWKCPKNPVPPLFSHLKQTLQPHGQSNTGLQTKLPESYLCLVLEPGHRNIA